VFFHPTLGTSLNKGKTSSNLVAISKITKQ